MTRLKIHNMAEGGPDRDGDRARSTWPRWGGWGTVVRHLRGAALEIALLRGGVLGSARHGTLVAAVCAVWDPETLAGRDPEILAGSDPPVAFEGPR